MRAALRLALLFALTLPLPVIAQDLDVRVNANQLYFAAPGLSFITGEALERLRNGSAVAFVFQIGTASSRTAMPDNLVTVRFVVSYDLWEEKFAVTRTGTVPRSVSNLTQQGAERWCLDALTLPATMPPEEPFWVTLSYREEQPASAAAEKEQAGFSLGAMVEIFSQRGGSRSPGRKEIKAGPFRLRNLGNTR